MHSLTHTYEEAASAVDSAPSGFIRQTPPLPVTSTITMILNKIFLDIRRITLETKAHQIFRSRIQYLEMHLQTIDVSLSVMRRSVPIPSDKNIVCTLGFEPSKYGELNHPVKERDRIINNSRARNSEYAVITLYGYFTEYLQNILREIFETKPLDVVGKAPKENTLTYAEIVKHGSYEAISEHIIGKIFRQLENERSTKELLDKILTKTVPIGETIKTNALKYLDMRHLFVHAAGIIDQQFVEKYGKDESLKVGNKIPTTYENARMAIEAVVLLCKTVDQELIKKGFVQQK